METQKLQELQKSLAEAIASNNVETMEKLAEEILKEKKGREAVARAETKKLVEKQLEEQKLLAGDREKLAITIHKLVCKLNLADKLKALKASGFTFKLDEPATYDMEEGNKPAVEYTAVSLTVPVIRIPHTKTGRTSITGKSKGEFGLSLQEIFDKFASEKDKANLLDAEAKDAKIKADTGKSNGVNAYNIKLDVKKAAITEGKLAPVK